MMARRTFLGALSAMAIAGPALGRTTATLGTVDTHAHVFSRALPLAERRRYSVDYDATPQAYRAMLAGNGMARGVLVQPSFLGFDNTYLLAALSQDPASLRGIAALDKTTPRSELERLAKAGIVGIRLNLIGRANPELGSAAWQRHLGEIAALGWQIEVQSEAGRLPHLLPGLLESGAPVVIDHFGRPDAALGIDDPGFRFLLNNGGNGRVYVKLSGAYRVGERIADRAAPLLVEAFGPQRLLWGSDWPHTQFEDVASPLKARAALDRWVPDLRARTAILMDTPAALFGFGGAEAANSHEAASI